MINKKIKRPLTYLAILSALGASVIGCSKKSPLEKEIETYDQKIELEEAKARFETAKKGYEEEVTDRAISQIKKTGEIKDAVYEHIILNSEEIMQDILERRGCQKQQPIIYYGGGPQTPKTPSGGQTEYWYPKVPDNGTPGTDY